MSILFPTIHGELLPQARSGHTAVFSKGQVLIHGGYGETYLHQRRWHDDYMDPSEIWIYNIEVSQWTRLGTTGAYPSRGLSGACACLLRDTMVVYGGFEDGFGRTSSVFQLDLGTLKWRNLTEENAIEGNYPSRRDKLVCWVHNNRIIYFGGFGFAPGSNDETIGEFCYEQYPLGPLRGLGWNNHVFVLDISNPNAMKWRYPEVKGSKPYPRAAHAGAKIDNYGFVFGGRYKADRLNDMFYLDLDTYEWHTINYSSGAPCGRSWHSLNSLSNRRLFLYGGLDTEGNPLSDIWLFDIKSTTWFQVNNDKLGQYASRMWHTGVTTDNGNQVMIFGGCVNSVLSDDPSIHCNLMFIYRTVPLSLENLCLYKILDSVRDLWKKLTMLPSSVRRRIYLHLHARGLALESENQSGSACAMS